MELELGLILTHLTQKPMPRVGVCAFVARESNIQRRSEGSCGRRGNPVGQVWSLGRSAFENGECE